MGYNLVQNGKREPLRRLWEFVKVELKSEEQSGEMRKRFMP